MGEITQDAAKRLLVTSAAASRLAELIAAEGDPALMLRLSVSGGGCSGFQYGFAFDDAVNEDDKLFEKDGVKVVVDEVSLDFLAGSELDYVEELGSAAFKVRNPQATSSCGCGSSFSV